MTWADDIGMENDKQTWHVEHVGGGWQLRHMDEKWFVIYEDSMRAICATRDAALHWISDEVNRRERAKTGYKPPPVPDTYGHW